MKPLRRKSTYQIAQDQATGQDRVLGETHENDVLSDEGSIDSTLIQRNVFLDCGCNAPSAGKCFQCDAYSCQAHHGICSRCRKPICLECSTFVDSDGKERRFCDGCYEFVSRKQMQKKVKHFFLSIFLEIEG